MTLVWNGAPPGGVVMVFFDILSQPGGCSVVSPGYSGPDGIAKVTFTAGSTMGVATVYASTVSSGSTDLDATITIETPLPVQLTSFAALNIGPGNVTLEWATISEVNNYGFYVERRSDGESAFTELAHVFIPGHGTTLSPQHYSYADNTVTPGVGGTGCVRWISTAQCTTRMLFGQR